MPYIPIRLSFHSTVLISLGALLFPFQMAKGSAELQVLRGNNEFAPELLEVVARNEGNVLVSPISVHAVLSMAYQGAGGTTTGLFANTLRISESKTAAEGYRRVLKRLNVAENITLHMANRVYLMQGCELLPGFRTALIENFFSDVGLLDFRESQVAARTINEWVAEKTYDKIRDLIKSDGLDALTRVVMVNAVYFKGNWKHRFHKGDTRTEPFYLNDVDKRDVQMMHMTRRFNYKRDERMDAQVLKMPYVNEDFSMIIILPNERNGIANLEKNFANIDLSEMMTNWRETEVEVALPKFKIEQTIDLKGALTELGLGEIFAEDKANFKNMGRLKPNENLYVSEVIQKAFIEVNEDGAEAAAASGVAMRMKRSMQRAERFYADRPFIYFIVMNNVQQELVLFCGKIAKVSHSDERHDEL